VEDLEDSAVQLEDAVVLLYAVLQSVEDAVAQLEDVVDLPVSVAVALEEFVEAAVVQLAVEALEVVELIAADVELLSEEALESVSEEESVQFTAQELATAQDMAQESDTLPQDVAVYAADYH
jgi:phosphoribosylaminoimidazole carboxylase (NCAIR synthetase)